MLAAHPLQALRRRSIVLTFYSFGEARLPRGLPEGSAKQSHGRRKNIKLEIVSSSDFAPRLYVGTGFICLSPGLHGSGDCVWQSEAVALKSTRQSTGHTQTQVRYLDRQRRSGA